MHMISKTILKSACYYQNSFMQLGARAPNLAEFLGTQINRPIW